MLLRPAIRLALVLALGVALSAAGCGDDDSGDSGNSQPAESGEGSGGTPTGADPASDQVPADATAQEIAGSYPEDPQLLLRFSQRPAGWPESVRRGAASAGYAGEGYRLRAAGGNPIRVAAERTADPAYQGVLLESEVRLPGPPGSAGLFCRGSADGQSGYALTVIASGTWRIDRVEDGASRELGSGPVDLKTTKPGQPTLLRFLCGAGLPGESLTLGFTVQASPLQFVNDPTSIAPDSGRLGVLLQPGPSAAEATFLGLAASYAE